mmetsp:Transcript_22236/g.45433  ORF Transcript_22236/g.45433 Transcript_22236/m.45433 type:complete len:127 (+) Transcript_22236:495-875(+)
MALRNQDTTIPVAHSVAVVTAASTPKAMLATVEATIPIHKEMRTEGPALVMLNTKMPVITREVVACIHHHQRAVLTPNTLRLRAVAGSNGRKVKPFIRWSSFVDFRFRVTHRRTEQKHIARTNGRE